LQIVLEFVIAQHSKEELQISHRKLVDGLRVARPIDAASGSPQWTGAIDTAMARYVRNYAQDHIQYGWHLDWGNDEHAISSWLGDFPQDGALYRYFGMEISSPYLCNAPYIISIYIWCVV
jgi:hypothetical protein